MALMAPGCTMPSASAMAATAAAAVPVPQTESRDTAGANQVLHILVGHSVVIRTEARLRRVLVGNPNVVTTATTAPNELVVTATTPGSSSVERVVPRRFRHGCDATRNENAF